MTIKDNKYFLIINPLAHSGKAEKLGKMILSLLEKRKVDFDFRWTKKSADAIDFAKDASKNLQQTVVAVGGDGTICEVITGLFSDNEIQAKPKLGVLHIGISPDFNKYHNIPTNLEDAIEVLLEGKTKSIDIGKITYYSDLERKQKAISYFASNVNVGLGPLIAGRANSRYRKYLGDFLGTLSAILISLVGFKKMKLKINIDGKEMYLERLINLTVGKDPFLASGVRVFNQIRPDDRRLYVLSIELDSWPNFLSSIPKLYIGNFLDYKGAKINYANTVEIDYCQEYPLIEFDGDIKGYLPAKIEVSPKALDVIVT